MTARAAGAISMAISIFTLAPTATAARRSQKEA